MMSEIKLYDVVQWAQLPNIDWVVVKELEYDSVQLFDPELGYLRVVDKEQLLLIENKIARAPCILPNKYYPAKPIDYYASIEEARKDNFNSAKWPSCIRDFLIFDR